MAAPNESQQADGQVPEAEELLRELDELLTSELHKCLIHAYRTNHSYEALLKVCLTEMEAKIDEIDKVHGPRNQGLQRNSNA